MPGFYGRRSNRPGRSAWPFLVALIVAVVLVAAACSSPGAAAPVRSAAAAPAGPAKAVIPPDTPAGAQLRWLIGALARLPLPDAQVRAHFDAAFLAQALLRAPHQLWDGLDPADQKLRIRRQPG